MSGYKIDYHESEILPLHSIGVCKSNWSHTSFAVILLKVKISWHISRSKIGFLVQITLCTKSKNRKSEKWKKEGLTRNLGILMSLK